MELLSLSVVFFGIIVVIAVVISVLLFWLLLKQNHCCADDSTVWRAHARAERGVRLGPVARAGLRAWLYLL